ncbi:MAG: D-sedoheptulose 7-phosphate isomerase [Bacteroidales bacterium]|nr:D-sedoheptulose 7-phosphate isomerase [Bacteroidales bacterium]
MEPMNDFLKDIRSHIEESVRTKQMLLADEALMDRIAQIAGVMVDAYKAGHKTLWAGNGGSAADAQHMAGELVNKFTFDRPGLAALSLSTDTSIITAVGNDYGFDRLFARQVEAQGCPGDVFIGISTSGKSPNLVNALAACRAKGITSVAIVGANPCPMDDYDYVIHVPSTVTPRIQECQTLIGHILCYIVEQELFG